MTVVECILINDCNAPKRVGNGVTKRAFRAGQRVRGTVTNVALTPDSQVLALKTKDGFIIPEPFLNILGEVNEGGSKQRSSDSREENTQYAEVVEDSPKEKSVATVLQSLKSADIISSSALKSKRVINFALGGAVVGVVYAMMKGKNKLLLAALGSVSGGVIGNYVTKKIKENGKSE